MARSPLFHILKTLLKNSAQNTLENPSRRTFVKGFALAGASSFLPNLPTRNSFLSFQKPVVILGAGAAGLAAAYELKRRSVPFIIYEASSRYGGRVQTKKNFNAEGMFGELGAELIDSNHTYLFQLAKELNLEMEKFNKDGLVNQAFYFRNQFVREEDLAIEFNKLVRHIQKDLNKIFEGQAERSVTYRTQSQIARHFDHMNLETYISSIENIDPYILDMVRVAYVCEFGLDAHQQSALNLLLLMDPEVNLTGDLYGASDEAWRVRGGNSNLMEALANEAAKAGEIYLDHSLVGIQEINSKIILNLQTPGGSKDVVCDQVICTIPFSVLNQIDGIHHLNLSERKRYAIANFPMGSNTKLISGFTQRAWADPAIYQNHFFHGQLCTQFDSQIFWDSSRNQHGRSGILTNYLGGYRASAADNSNYNKSISDFSKIYPGSSAYLDGNMALANWSKNPFSLGSYACPTPGSYTTYLGSLALPELNNKLHFAGEHTSDSSLGYINGALESGRIAALNVANHPLSSLSNFF